MESSPPVDVINLPLAQLDMSFETSQTPLPKTRGKRTQGSTKIVRGAKRSRISPLTLLFHPQS